MHKYLVLIAVLLGTNSAFAASFEGPKPPSYEQTALMKEILPALSTGDDLARRGCCSHHGGVSGCSGGSVTCADGSFSPTCTCNHEDPPQLEG